MTRRAVIAGLAGFAAGCLNASGAADREAIHVDISRMIVEVWG
jgi:hypothetical protein